MTASRCSTDYCQDPRITKNIIHLQAPRCFYTSDAAVRAVSYEEVSRSAAYMLFYEREADTCGCGCVIMLSIKTVI